jgi:hypothetical protein
MPFTADCGVVPLSVAPEVPVPGVIPSAIDAELLVSRTPLLSRTLTVTAGEIATPEALFVGCWPNWSWDAVCGHVALDEDAEGPGSYTQT